jgi:GNAT superfamily N-acetyltransferase
MSSEDFEFAVQLTDRMNWDLAVADFEFMTELEPEGCFLLLENSQRIGLATTINFGTIAWFGNLIVDERHRREGAGNLLVEHSVKYLTDRGAKAIGLYAYTDKIPFYRRLGFQSDSEFSVLRGVGSSSPAVSTVREAEKQELRQIIEFDRTCFGASRKKLLEPIMNDSDNICHVSMKDGQVVGYVVAKVYRHMGEVGPLICRREHDDVAINLLKMVLSRLEGYEVSMCVPSKETLITEKLKKLGFAESFRVSRMFIGSPIVNDCISVSESLERG